MPVLRFENSDITVNADSNITILEAMRMAGLSPEAPCGGNGKCGKCKVYLNGSKEPVLSCQTLVGNEDLLIGTQAPETGLKILEDGGLADKSFEPHIKRVEVTVPPCPIGKSISDWTRLYDEIVKVCPEYEGKLYPDPYIASKLGVELKKNDKKVNVILADNKVLDVSAEKKDAYMAAFDIGTTTVVGYLLSADNGERVSVASRLNPQVKYGADVISRAAFSLENGMDEITSCIQEAIDGLVKEMCDKEGISTDDVYMISIAGNTCMHHLFLGISVDSLVHAPYNPAVREEMILRASDYGVHINKNGLLYALPNIAGFVGADTVACIVSSDIAKQKDWTLLIDIGTNGEMVLAKDYKMVVCSTAAGPAFEGVGISKGMRGAAGAISKAVCSEDGWQLEVIDGKPAIGICGSGLLDLAAEMLRTEFMDENGKMDEERIILVPADKSGDGEDVFICQKDIRELQMAKAAIRAGIELLCAHVDITPDDVKEVWLAGAFGNFLNPMNVCRIGMIPPQLRDRIVPIGNAAGLGAQAVLLNVEQWEKAAELSSKADFIELATIPDFQDCFADALEFDNF